VQPQVIVCRSPLADSLPADALRELHRYAESDDVVSAGLDANQRAFMAAVRGPVQCRSNLNPPLTA